MIINVKKYQEFVEYEEGTVNYSIQNSLQTGDIVIFKSNIIVPNVFNSLYRFLSKINTGYEYYHVGIIILDEDDNFPYILEQTPNNIQFLPFDERLLHSTSTEVIIRKLETKRTDEMITNARNFVKVCLQQQDNTFKLNIIHKLCIISRLILYNFLSDLKGHHSRVHVTGVLTTLTEDLKQQQIKIKKEKDLNIKNNIKLRDMVREYIRTQAEYARAETIFFNKTQKRKADQLSNYIGVQLYPDIELVVTALQSMSLLPNTIEDLQQYKQVHDQEKIKALSIYEYNPSHFHDKTILPLQNNAVYLKSLHLKTQK